MEFITFKLSEYEIEEICKSITLINNNIHGKVRKDTPLEEKIKSIKAWMQTMKPEDRFVYMLGRKI